MRGQSANKLTLADAGRAPCGEGPCMQRSGSLRGEATYKSGARCLARLHRELISPYLRPTRTNEPPTRSCISGESKPASSLLMLRNHQISRQLSGNKKKEIFLPRQKRNQHEHPHQHYHRTHTQDLRLFRCELSKVTSLPLILSTLRLRYNPSVTRTNWPYLPISASGGRPRWNSWDT